MNSAARATLRFSRIRRVPNLQSGQPKRCVSDAVHDTQNSSYTYPVRSVCKATIVGRTGAAPRHYAFGDGGESLMFSIATSEARVSNGVRDPETRTQWNRVVVSDSVPGFETILKDLQPGALVFVEGNLKVTKKSTESGEHSEYVDIRVSRAQGTFRVLSRGSQGGDDELPF